MIATPFSLHPVDLGMVLIVFKPELPYGRSIKNDLYGLTHSVFNYKGLLGH